MSDALYTESCQSANAQYLKSLSKASQGTHYEALLEEIPMIPNRVPSPSSFQFK
jgi:hypothetical protein